MGEACSRERWSQVIFWEARTVLSGTCNHEVAFRHLQTSPTSSTCLLHQFPFEYVTLRDKQAYIGDYNSKKVF